MSDKSKIAAQKLKGLPLERNPNWKGGRTIASNGYILVKRPEHPCADVRGYVYEHRLFAEEKVGRLLLPGEIVHHHNGVKTDNRLENLEVLKNTAHHRAQHRKPDSNLRLPEEDNPTILCECGCGAELSAYDRFGRPRKFISGHNLRRR